MDDDTEKAVRALTRLPLFPFEGEFALKTIGPPMAAELVRDGEGGKPCHSCGKDDRVLWRNDRWKVTFFQPSINPVGLFLETIDHLDFDHFDDALAAEFGLLTWRLEEAVRSIESVGRVHVHRWGDGSSHFHVWFQGRPARQVELYGWGNVLWSQLLPPLDTSVIDANHLRVVTQLAASVGGTVVGGAGLVPPNVRDH